MHLGLALFDCECFDCFVLYLWEGEPIGMWDFLVIVVIVLLLGVILSDNYTQFRSC